MVRPETLELTVLSSISSIEDFEKYRNLGIDENSFIVDEFSATWDYFNRRAKLGEIPTREDVRSVCSVELLDNITDRVTPVEELVKITLQRKATAAILDQSRNLPQDPEAAIRNLIGDLSDITKGSNGHVTFFDANAQDRLAEVRRRIEARSKGEMVGIPTGLSCFDDEGNLFQKGEMVAIIGTTSVGKSWLTLYCCSFAYWHANARVLILSPESTNFEIEARLDVITARLMGRTLSNRAIMRGYVDQAEYEAYLAELSMSGRKDLKVRDSGDAGTFSVSDIISLTREFRPDILAIDGFHLIKGVGKSWENVKDAAETIKGVGQHMGFVTIAGSQATREAAMAIDDTPELGQTAYGMGLVETANRVITLVENRSNKKQRIFKVPKNRGDEKITQRQYLQFDVDIGDIRQLVPDIDRETGEVNW